MGSALRKPKDNIISLQDRPRCANPKCNNYVITTPGGRLSKYCANPQCPKTAYEVRHRSAEARANLRDKALYAEAYAHAQADLIERHAPRLLPALDTSERLLSALENIAARLEQPRQLPLPLSDVGQSTRAAPTSKPSDDGIKVNKPAKAGNSARILILQVWLASNLKNLELFSMADLELVAGHPAFNQALIQAEIKRRMAAPTAPTIPAPTPTPDGPRPIPGSERELSAPNFDDLDLL